MCEIDLCVNHTEKRCCMILNTIFLSRGIVGEDRKIRLTPNKKLEDWIEFILEHEILHIVLEQRVCSHISDLLDKVNLGDSRTNSLVWRIKKNGKEMVL